GDGIVYAGAADNVPGMLKLAPARPFQLGDEMRYSGYASGQRSQTVTHYQTTDETVQLVFIADGTPCPGAPTVTDIDGNVYNTVHIGDQCWMRENLRVTRYENGDSIAYAGTIRSDSVAYRYAPNNDINNVNKYGYLYNGFAIMHGASSSNTIPSGVQGICPIGWHLPSQMEIFELREYVSKQNRYSCGGISTYIAKALSDTVGWHADEHFCSPGNDLTSNNATGFSALPAGSRFSWQYVYYGYTSRYWTCTYYYGYFSILFIHASNNTVAMGENEPKDANSVRCLKD
ncbi:MAG: fibrobacter succinogenes major paralogous domain-containing protein, partial [Bacteroidales bacterium]|nr:fibrobacter succinogenes major paralogous domain-containing protein [Bacteroidales bacterium]